MRRKIRLADIVVVGCIAIILWTIGSVTVKVFWRGEEIERTKAEPKGLALTARNKFSAALERSLGDGREKRLGAAYLLGEKDGLDKETTEMLRAVGLSHIVVASGTHLGIIVGFFRKRFGKISRFAGMFFSFIFILLFGELIGWTASITRAAIVAIIGILAWYNGCETIPWRLIVIAMAITLLINPMYLADLGWLLSFASFSGIMILAPRIRIFFYGDPPTEEDEKTDEAIPGELQTQKSMVIAEVVISSVAATAMCAPILLYFFGNLSLISIVANVMILPTIPLAMGLAFLSGLTGFLPFDFLASFIGEITKVLLNYHLVVIEFFSKQTAFLIEIPTKNALVFLLYIPILLPFIVGEIINAQRDRKRIRQFHAKPEQYLRFKDSDINAKNVWLGGIRRRRKRQKISQNT